MESHSRIVTIILLIVAALIVYIVVQVLRTQHYIKIGEALAATTVPFSRATESPSMRILIVGDSTAVGVGTSGPSTSIAGLVGTRYPKAEITNFGVSGAKVKDLIKQLETVEGTYDLVMVHIGGNDIVRFTPLDELKIDIRTALDLAASHGKHVLVTTTGNIATVRLFPAPTRWIFRPRTLKVREIFMSAAAATNGDARYTDLFRERAQDPYATNPQKYYAADMFHPSDAGYADWFTLISKELDQFSL
ncbi:MAG: GDSL-type esterase/lipase family protein [Patescibacteria group bacterium]